MVWLNDFLKRLLIIIAVLCSSLILTQRSNAQIPYYAPTMGNGNVEAYTSLKIRPGVKTLGSYNSFQYGIGKEWSVGTDVTIANGSAMWGFIGRYGHTFSKRFKLGGQVTPAFSLTDGFKLDNISVALYLNGAITQDESLFWVSNTFYNYNRNFSDDIEQWIYLGYKILLPKATSLTPMIGTLYSWKMDNNPDLGLGAYYSISKFNFYLWGDDLFKHHPRIVFGIEICM